MSSSFHQMPRASAGAEPQPMSNGRIVAWLLLLSAMMWPRVTIFAFWLFDDALGNAFDGWVVPLAGFFLLPATTLAYAWMWALSSDGTTGAEWLVIALAFGYDVLTWVAARALR